MVDGIRSAFRAGKRAPLVVSPTGSGKTVTFSYIAENAASKGNKVWILAHREELLDQISASLSRFNLRHGMIAAGRTPDPFAPAQVASVQTLVRRLSDVQAPDLIICDEAHHAAAGSWGKILQAFPKARTLGFTATPERLDGKGLGDAFDDIVMGPSVSWLIQNGFLCKPVYYAPSSIDVSSMRRTAGDFNKSDAELAVDKPVITGCAVSHYKKICDGVPAIAFCASVRHAEHVAQQFNEAGYRFAVIEGRLEKNKRKELVKKLSNGDLHGLTSCDIVSEGFDLPIVTAAIMLRPTSSLSLYLQQVGRALRPHDTKTNAIILDHVGNVLRHGFAEDIRDWSLEGAKQRKKSDKEKALPMKQCPSCYGIHAPASHCPLCGHEHGIKARQLEQVEGELQALTSEDIIAKSRRRDQGKAKTLHELIELGKKRGYRNPAAWASHIIRARGYGAERN